ncbi:hypothetical protein ILYODFUR_001071 [Ilyodon furcidens]|uniref:Uncharacterized protein n=1 Tax=Ilyodon furcidens TaxID=33524 RepID=A0ABV0SHL0_9TELE
MWKCGKCSQCNSKSKAKRQTDVSVFKMPWKSPPSRAQGGTYRLINKHCQCVIQVTTGDHTGRHGTARGVSYCKLLASLPSEDCNPFCPGLKVNLHLGRTYVAESHLVG